MLILLYPLIKYLVYFEFIIQGVLPANNKHSIFREKKVKAVSQVDDSLLKKLSAYEKNLDKRFVEEKQKIIRELRNKLEYLQAL